MPITIVINADLSTSSFSPYDLALGRLGLPTIFDDITESVGDSLDTVGAGVVPGQRSPRPLNINIPIHGLSSNSDPWSEGDRMRRQMRSLMDNAAARLRGIYMTFRPDSELNGWLILGGGEIAYKDGGVTFSNYEMALKDAYMVANLRTHRPARRLEIYDRRLVTTARDIQSTVYTSDFATKTGLALGFLQPGAVNPMYLRNTVVPGARQALDGQIPVVASPTNLSTVFYELGEVDINRGGVVILDRRGNTTAVRIYRNETTNPSGEADGTTGWATGATTGTLVPPTQQTANRPGSTGTKAFQSGVTGFTGGGALVGRETPAKPCLAGQTVRAYGWGRVTTAASTLELGVEWLDATGTLLTKVVVGTVTPVTNTWYEFSNSLVAPAGAFQYRLAFRGTMTASGTNTIQYDDMMSLVSASPTSAYTGPYFDGDYPSSRWTGTTDVSPSETGFNLNGDVNPQTQYQWEEVYGRNHPLTDGDVPILQNGLTRVRYDAATASFAVEKGVFGVGYAEIARVYFTQGRAGAVYNVLQDVVVDEWVYERGRLKIIMGGPGRLEVYVTLEHGHLAARFEAYGTYPFAALAVRVVQAVPGSTVVSAGTTTAPSLTDPADATSLGGLSDSPPAYAEPWAQLRNTVSDERVAMAYLTMLGLYTYRDTLAFGSLRQSVAAESLTGGYVSVHVGPAIATDGAPAYAGKNDLWQSALMDALSIPDLVAR